MMKKFILSAIFSCACFANIESMDKKIETTEKNTNCISKGNSNSNTDNPNKNDGIDGIIKYSESQTLNQTHPISDDFYSRSLRTYFPFPYKMPDEPSDEYSIKRLAEVLNDKKDSNKKQQIGGKRNTHSKPLQS